MGRTTASRLEDTDMSDSSDPDTSTDDCRRRRRRRRRRPGCRWRRRRRRRRRVDVDVGVKEGDVVATCDESSTENHPVVILGKVVHVSSRRGEVFLAHLAPDKANDNQQGLAFKFVVGRTSWREDVEALIHPVDVEFEEESRI